MNKNKTQQAYSEFQINIHKALVGNLETVYNICIILVCVIGGALAAQGITDESVVATNGDMPKYLMNGVYFFDLARDILTGHIKGGNIFNHAVLYFSQYPALSLGHHPILLGLTLPIFYTLFGISVCSARIMMISFFVMGIFFLFLLVRKIYNAQVALLASLIFATTPFIVEYSQIVMSEVPTISLTILTSYLFYNYYESDKSIFAYLTALTLVLSVYSKHLAIFIIPVFFLFFLLKKGKQALIRREVLISSIGICLLLIPLVLITLKYSQNDVASATTRSLRDRLSTTNLLFYAKMIWTDHLSHPIAILGGIGILSSLVLRDRRSVFFLLWIGSCYLMMVALGVHKYPRYAVYWIPAFCVMAASLAAIPLREYARYLVILILIISIGYQAIGASKAPSYAGGYENAVEYVTGRPMGDVVLYSSVVDTGYFVYFMRKHDPDRSFIVLRSDKIFATSCMNRIVEDRISSRKDIYDLLQRYGVGYVVVEDYPSSSPALEWLREEVKTDQFILRKTIPLRSDVGVLQGVSLNIFEYKHHTPGNPNEVIDMDIPLVGETFRVKLGDLLHSNRTN